MPQIGRRAAILTGVGLALSAVTSTDAGADTMPETIVYTARHVITMDADVPDATAVAVRDGRIVAVGSLEDLRDRGVVDDTFAEAVLVPGLIDQHLHPILGATTLTTEVIAIEDWVLPGNSAAVSALGLTAEQMAGPRCGVGHGGLRGRSLVGVGDEPATA
jgi:predicted amidohydrolase YtcJ